MESSDDHGSSIIPVSSVGDLLYKDMAVTGIFYEDLSHNALYTRFECRRLNWDYNLENLLHEGSFKRTNIMSL